MKNWSSKIVIGLVFLFLYLPIIVLIVFSFNDTKLNILFEGFTLKWYGTLAENRTLLEAFKNTLVVAIISTLISTVIGTIGAFGLSRYDFKGKKLINSLIYIPIVMPDIVIGISLLAVYTLMRLSLGMFTLILAHIAFSIPYVLVSVRSTLEGMNPYLEEASSDLGASALQTFFRVTLPTIAPGILSGAMLVFTLSMDDVVVSYFTAGPEAVTLPQYIYSMIKSGISPDVNALFSLMLLVTLIGLTVYSLILFKRRVKV
ncbi:MAG: ABC transporter permease [Bacilli bacterium]|nr:ABC transporter permease [Bacilli bacterium]